VADPEILKLEGKTSPSSFIANAHMDIHVFYTGKGALLKKILRQIDRKYH